MSAAPTRYGRDERGRFVTWSLEVQVASGCNLRCARCCTFAPHLSESFVEPEAFAADLARAAAVLAPRRFKLTGGEPLRHPKLVELLQLARAAAIAPVLQVTTNGLLLATAPEALFQAVDRLQVSHYASAPLSPSALERIRARCEANGVELEVRSVSSFQRMSPAGLLHDSAATQAAFEGCWLRHRCHTLDRGRLYLCSRPPRQGEFLRAHGQPSPDLTDDGLALESVDLPEAVEALLHRTEPLAACRGCLGGGGDWAPHRQLPRGAHEDQQGD